MEIYEGIRQYPLFYYYHSRHAYRSLPFAFRMVWGMAGALRFGLPKDQPASQTPWLPTLLTGLDIITDFFEAVLLRDKEPADYWLGRFLQMNTFMRDLVHLEDPLDPEEAYGRYERWLDFAYHNRAFFETSARDLGYDIKELESGPGKRLF